MKHFGEKVINAAKPHRAGIILLAGLIALVCSHHLYLVWEPQPALSELLWDIANGSAGERTKAIEAVKRVVPNPGPRLVGLLTVRNDSPGRKRIIGLVREHCPARLNRSFMLSEDLRQAAAVALAEVGKARGENRANLKPALEDPRPRIRYLGAFVLAQAGPSGADVPSLIIALRDSDAGVRDQAILALAKGGEKSRDATQALTTIARSQSSWSHPPYGWSHRSNACVALVEVGASNPLVLKALTEASQDRDPRVRQTASQALTTLRAASE